MCKKIRVHLTIKGKVQGVFFRLETQKTAKKAGVFGWVKNVNNGDVEALLEGDQEAVHDVVQWCHNGPSASRVDKVIVTDQGHQGEFNDFYVTY